MYGTKVLKKTMLWNKLCLRTLLGARKDCSANKGTLYLNRRLVWSQGLKWLKKRMYSQKLSSDFHVNAMAHSCPSILSLSK